jgi:hypothetical protein
MKLPSLSSTTERCVFDECDIPFHGNEMNELPWKSRKETERKEGRKEGRKGAH